MTNPPDDNFQLFPGLFTIVRNDFLKVCPCVIRNTLASVPITVSPNLVPISCQGCQADVQTGMLITHLSSPWLDKLNHSIHDLPIETCQTVC